MLYLLPQAVDRAAAKDSAWPAMRFGGETLTDGELAVQSNQLASVLVEMGVRRGDRVGIFAGKGLIAGVAIHGIMKAGAAYVPLDPEAPSARTARIVEDGGIHTVVVDPRNAEPLEPVRAATKLRAAVGVETDGGLETISWEAVGNASADSPRVHVIERDLAYVLYTSGSTGRPKGVAHTHRSALAFAEIAVATYGFTRDDRLTNHAPLQFDLSTMDYFSAAVAGATTVIVPEAHTKLPASLSKLLQDEAMTVLYMVPFALTQLLLNGALEKRDLGAVRWVLFGGEPFPPKYLKGLMDRLTEAKFSNVYGPTEVNGVTYWVVPPIPEGSDEAVPIGRAYQNVETLVVDDEGRATPRGRTGELLIRSPTMMKGYWGRPDLDEQVFERRTVGHQLDDVFFRTGDLVRDTGDGVLEFLGRNDRQIKTRGYRVELDEVEAALLRHETVEHAAAYPVPDDQGSQTIEATAVTAATSDISIESLIEHLRAELPSYAVPARLELRDRLPRTATGKVDRVELRTQAIARGSPTIGEGPPPEQEVAS